MKFQIELQLKEQGTKIDRLEKDLKKLGSTSKKTQKDLSGFSKTVGNMTKALAGYVAVSKGLEVSAGFVKGIIKTAAAFERYEAILSTLEGSNKKAKKSFEWIKDFAKTTPFELEKVTEAYVKMKSFGLDTNNLRTYGDAAAGMGKDVIQVVEAMADAVTGQNERLVDLGIKGAIAGDKIVYAWTNASGDAKTIVLENNKKIIESTLSAIFNSKYKGGMDKLSRTYEGLTSNVADAYTQLQQKIAAESGLFDNVKESVSILIKEFDNLAPDTKSIQTFGNVMRLMIRGSLEGLVALIKTFGFLSKGVNAFGSGFTIVSNAIKIQLNNMTISFIETQKTIVKIAWSIRQSLANIMPGDKFQKQADGLVKTYKELDKKVIEIRKSSQVENAKLAEEGFKTAKNYVVAEKNKAKVIEDMVSVIDKLKAPMRDKTLAEIESIKVSRELANENEKVAKNAKVAGAMNGTLSDGINSIKDAQSGVKSIGFTDYLRAIGQESKAATIELNAQVAAMLASDKFTPKQVEQFKAVKTKEIKSNEADKNAEINNQKLQNDLFYYEQTKNYEKAQLTEMNLYKQELLSSDYSKQEQLDLENVKVDELKLKYAGLRDQELESQTSLSAGFNTYMNDLESRSSNYSGMVNSMLQSTENIMANSMNSLFDQAAEGSLNLEETMKQMTASILKMIQQMITKMIVMKAIQAATGGSGGGFSSLFANANGGVYDGGKKVNAYATGGVVNSPTYFPMQGNNVGLMGEAGPEAIMPLTRDGQGRLGVRNSGGGESSKAGNITINNHSNANVSASKQSNGDTVITVKMLEEIDQRLAARSLQGRSESDKVMNAKYNMNRQY